MKPHTRELLSAGKMSHKHSKKDLNPAVINKTVLYADPSPLPLSLTPSWSVQKPAVIKQHARELISAQKMSHKHSNKDLNPAVIKTTTLIQTHKRFKRMLFIRRKTRSVDPPPNTHTHNKQHSFEPFMLWDLVLDRLYQIFSSPNKPVLYSIVTRPPPQGIGDMRQQLSEML